jgi:hypothetical protein
VRVDDVRKLRRGAGTIRSLGAGNATQLDARLLAFVRSATHSAAPALGPARGGGQTARRSTRAIGSRAMPRSHRSGSKANKALRGGFHSARRRARLTFRPGLRPLTSAAGKDRHIGTPGSASATGRCSAATSGRWRTSGSNRSVCPWSAQHYRCTLTDTDGVRLGPAAA